MDKEEDILPAVATLSSSPVLGVDSEWEPSFRASFGLESGSSSPTSILQARTSQDPFDEGRTLSFPRCNCNSATCTGTDASVSAQVASRTSVVIFDMYKLGQSSLLDGALATLLCSEYILKLGCGVGDDIRTAARSYGRIEAFQNVRGLVDLRTLFAQHVQATGLEVCAVPFAGLVPLSACRLC